MSADRGSKACLTCFKICGVLLVLLVGLSFVVGLISWLFEVPETALGLSIDIPDETTTYQYVDGQFQGEPIDYTISVINYLSEGLDNVTVSDNVGFQWTGSLDANEGRDFDSTLDWCAHQCTVIEAFVEGYLTNGTRCFNNASANIGSCIYGGCHNLSSALDNDFVSCEFRGRGYCSGLAIRLILTSQLNLTIDISLEPGMILINSGSGQNMILLDQRTLEVEAEIEASYDLEGYCLDLHKGNPSIFENFTILNGTGEYGDEISALFDYLSRLPSSARPVIAVQLAIWVLTDDIARDEIPFDYSESDIEKARELLEGAGFDVSEKRLFQESG